MKKILSMILCLGMFVCFTACDFGKVNVEDEKIKSGENISNNDIENNTEIKLETNDKYSNVEKNPVVTMEMENGDVVKMELYPKVAPTTVENFISLVESGFYDGLTFHRVIPIFMAQGGDPSGDGTGGPGYSIKGEFSENNFKNDITHEIGVVSMARAQDPDTAGSQFFIVTDENSYMSLDTMYAAFGKVIEGMDAVYTIVNSEVIRTALDADVESLIIDANNILAQGGELTVEHTQAIAKYYQQMREMDRPINPPVIKSMTVETFGYEYDEPEKIMK